MIGQRRDLRLVTRWGIFFGVLFAVSVSARELDKPRLFPESWTIVPPDTFRVVGDFDSDGLLDTLGYTRERPWNRIVACFSTGLRWIAFPGEGLDSLYADVNAQRRRELRATGRDSLAWWSVYERYKICPENVEHAPVMIFGGRLVVMWFMEPLWPSGINTYDMDGRLLSRFVHPGHLRALCPLVLNGCRYLTYGGANNVVDAEIAKMTGCTSLNLPIVGVQALGTSGFQSLEHKRLQKDVRQRVPVARDGLYQVIDWGRNSQVHRLRDLSDGRLEWHIEKGSVRGDTTHVPARFGVLDIRSTWGLRHKEPPAIVRKRALRHPCR